MRFYYQSLVWQKVKILSISICMMICETNFPLQQIKLPNYLSLFRIRS